MARQLWIAEVLRAAGLTVREYPGWRTRGSTTFTPRGVVVHHTGPWSTVEGMVRLCAEGRSDLAGPLCQVVLAPDGVCHVIAAGRANHAGSGGWRGLSGNTSVFGIEAVHAGSAATPWPEVQLRAFVVCAAALAQKIGAGADLVCGHKEWRPGDKIDPISIDMNAFRQKVFNWLHPAPPPPPPAPREGVIVVNRPPLKILSHPTWTGYIVITDDGGVFSFNAPFYGSLGGVVLNKPIVDAEVTPSGEGYWMMGADGGIFAFGDAEFAGRVEYAG